MIYLQSTESEVMMNENDEILTMEDEPIATVVQNMRKGSRWLSTFLEGYRPPLDGERYLTDKEVADLLRVPPYLAGVPQQQGTTLYPLGGQGTLSRIGTSRTVRSKLPQAVGIKKTRK